MENRTCTIASFCDWMEPEAGLISNRFFNFLYKLGAILINLSFSSRNTLNIIVDLISSNRRLQKNTIYAMYKNTYNLN